MAIPDSEASDPRLEALRHRIRRLDAALLALVAERMELAREVGEAKRAAAIPLRDFEVEKRVLARAGEQARELGLGPELAQGLMQQLILEACRVQEEAHFSGYSGNAESVLLVGGGGRMGGWLARFFANQGHAVRSFDVRSAGSRELPSARSLEEGLEGSTLTVVAVPLDGTAAAIEAVAGSGWRGTLFDVASLKGHLRPALDRAREAGLAVTSVHPMFGPSARVLSDKVICLCDCGDPAATDRAAGLFRETAARLVYLSLEDHDRIASRVLGLSHFVNLLFARALAESGLSRAELDAVGSTTFHAQLATTASVLHEDPDLYFAIQRLNPFTPEVYAGLERALREWVEWVGAADRPAFVAAMEKARGWL